MSILNGHFLVVIVSRRRSNPGVADKLDCLVAALLAVTSLEGSFPEMDMAIAG
jgi:hypothetical protein